QHLRDLPGDPQGQRPAALALQRRCRRRARSGGAQGARLSQGGPPRHRRGARRGAARLATPARHLGQRERRGPLPRARVRPGDRESSEESVSLGAAPLGTEALAATDFDDPGDTMVESNPAERLRAIAADEDFRVPGPGGSTSARNSPAGGGAGDFPPASLRPASGKGAGPVRTSFDSAERPTRSERGGGGRAAEDAAVAAASRPTVLEMQAPVISGGAAPGAPHGVLATPPPGPAPRTPPPAQAPRPRVEEPSISVYDTPPPVSAGSLRPPWADGAPAGHPPSERRPAPAPAQAPQPSGQPGGER